MRGTLSFCLLALAVSFPAAAQTAAPAVDANRKQARAVRANDDAIHLDGHLDEAIWQQATPVTDFLQAEPTEGAAPSDSMEVRFVYDNQALWVGARMRSTNERGVQAPMSRRDDGDQAEYLQIELDTYLDRRTAYMFGVTAAGVRLDHYHPSDNEDDIDAQFEPVWQAKTSITDDGWTAEMWIPFSQLRFNNAPQRVWGLNIKRWRPTLNEQDYWVVIGRTATGWASRFGDLRGIDGVSTRQRIELLPYVASSSRMTGNRDRNNPFDDGLNLTGRVGADAKIGIGSNLTLETTFNPDFGQIEADPAEVNLTVFETIFDERRPFFIEGNSVLEAGTSNYYYSRRIGARPTEPAPGDYVDYPDVSTILGAAKLTGRTISGTSVGFLAALTDEEHAKVSTAGIRSDVEVAPRTFWGVGRVIQQFGNQGSTVGAHLTMVHRDVPEGTPLALTEVRNAITTGGDARVRWANRTYEASGNVGLTFLDGDPAAIERVQRSSGHYLQRLDQPNIRLDPTRTDLQGAQIVTNIGKIGGRHWLWGANGMFEFPEFHPLDFGRLNYAGDLQVVPRITYRETRPGKYLRAYSFQLSATEYWFFDTDLGGRTSVNSSNSFTFKNFWVGSLNFTRYFRGNDVQATRGGPSMGTPEGWSSTISLRNSTASKTRWSQSTSYRRNDYGEHSFEVTGSIASRPTPSLQFSFEPDYINETGTTGIFSGPIGNQYLTTLTGGSAATFGRRYIFGLPDRTQLTAQFRVSYVFKPDVTLDVYAEPFAASGQYRGIGELSASRSQKLRLYGTDGTSLTRLSDGSYQIVDGVSTFTLSNRDFNVRSFRSNVVLKWEWRPGSTLYAVWQQNRASSATEGSHVGVGDLFGSLSAEGDNIFAIKSTLWLSR